MNITEFRQKYPMYDKLSDTDLSDRLYQKYYADKLPKEEFLNSFVAPAYPQPETPEPSAIDFVNKQQAQYEAQRATLPPVQQLQGTETRGFAPQLNSFKSRGNIDIFNRPIHKNKDGSISTVRSISFNEDGKEILIPTISDNGQLLTLEQAIDLYHKTGKYLGKFNSVAEADKYAVALHKQQAALYEQKKPKHVSSKDIAEFGYKLLSGAAHGEFLPKRAKPEEGVAGFTKNMLIGMMALPTYAAQLGALIGKDLIVDPLFPELAQHVKIAMEKNQKLPDSYLGRLWQGAKDTGAALAGIITQFIPGINPHVLQSIYEYPESIPIGIHIGKKFKDFVKAKGLKKAQLADEIKQIVDEVEKKGPEVFAEKYAKELSTPEVHPTKKNMEKLQKKLAKEPAPTATSEIMKTIINPVDKAIKKLDTIRQKRPEQITGLAEIINSTPDKIIKAIDNMKKNGRPETVIEKQLIENVIPERRTVSREQPQPVPESGKINAITRKEAGQLIAEGKPEVIPHIKEGLASGRLTPKEMQDTIRNQVLREIAKAPKEKRGGIKANYKRLQPEIDKVLKGEKTTEKLPSFPVSTAETLHGEVVPGASAISAFVERDLLKPFKGKQGILRDIAVYARNWLEPDRIKDAVKAKLRQANVDIKHFISMTQNAIDARKKWWDKVPKDRIYTFLDNVEMGKINAQDMERLFGKEYAKTMSGIAKEYRARLEKTYQLDKTYNQKMGYIENYFPHIWKNPERAAEFFSAYAKKLGKPGFMKKRYHEFIKDGIDAGLKLKTDNPEQLVVMRETASYQHARMNEFLNEMKDIGLLKFKKGIGRPPMGWSVVDNAAMRVYFRSEKGMVHAGDWIMPDQAAKVLNNYLSPSLWSNPKWYGKIFRTAAAVKSFIVAVKLGLSLFHLSETTVSSIASGSYMGLRSFARGDIKTGVKGLAKALSSPVLAMKKGGDIIRAWDKGPETPEQAAAIDLMKRGGFSPKMDRQWLYGIKGQWDKALEEFRHDNIIGGTIRLIPAVAEAIQKPIMEYYVPRLKVYNYLELVKRDIETHPDLTRIEQDIRLAKLSDSIDNRFGQLIYDNLFWNKTLKDIGVFSSLSLGWNLGTIREFGGAMNDAAKVIAKLGKMDKTFVADRMYYSVTYAALFGTIGSLITYANTGKAPSLILDYYYPKTGNKNPDGSDERLQMPTMMKEFFASTEAVNKKGLLVGVPTYIWHKTNPLVSLTLDMLLNKNFYGAEIRDPHAPIREQAKQVAIFLGTEGMIPISLSGYLRHKGITGKSTAAPFMGFVPAPSYITQSPIQSEIYELASKRFGGTISVKTAEKRTFMRELKQLIRQKNKTEIIAKYREGVQKGYINPRMRKQIFKRARRAPDINTFGMLPEDDQDYLLNKMSLTELKRYLPVARVKLRRKYFRKLKGGK